MMSEIPQVNPFVKGSNWKILISEGWRWVLDFPIRTETNSDDIDTTIEQYQTAYGVSNVTIGNAFNHYAFHPAGYDDNIQGTGLYIKDADQLIDELRRDLREFELTGVIEEP